MLDLFCGAGGAAVGYQRAGFDVVGVDHRPQPDYPFRFIQDDAMEWLRTCVVESDDPMRFYAIHASPPCQGYSPHVSSSSSQWAGTMGKEEPRLIEPLRELLRASGLPYVIENVVGAPLLNPVRLCGTMFGLPLARHRLFESNVALTAPDHGRCKGVALDYATGRGWDPRDMTVTGKGRHAGTTDRWKEVMGWPDTHVTQHGLREAIPPAYTEWIGTALIDHQLGIMLGETHEWV